MDADRPELLWTPEIARRTKAQVLMEEWKALDLNTVYENREESESRSCPPPNTWTTFRGRPLSLFYQARSCPPLPSMKELRNVTPNDRLHANTSAHSVCRLGASVIKFSYHANVLEVSKQNISTIPR
jgi:hypothetical protein